jgi:outer membrane protein TolC
MKRVFIILFLAIAGHAGFAQRLTLEEAINIALKNSLDIQLQKNNVEIADINNYIGVAGGLPTVTANGTFNKQIISTNQELNDGENIKVNGRSGSNMSANVQAGMVLFNGWRVVAAKNRLEELEGQSEKLLNAQVQNTMGAVMTTYFDVVRQQAYIKVLNQSIAVAQKRLDIVKTQQSVGMANNADLFQSQLDLNNLLQQRESQILIVQQAKTDMLALLTLRPDSLITIEDTIIVDRSLTLGDVLTNIEYNAEIMAAQDQVQIQEFIVREIRAQRYPTLRATAGYNFSRNQTGGGNVILDQRRGPVAGLTLGIPIYNGSIFRRQQRVAEINVKNAELQREILLRDFRAGAVKSFQAYDNSLKQIEAQQKNVELAQQLLDLALLRYQYREATILEVREAQQSFEDASYVLINLSFAGKSSEIEVKRLMNKITL